MFPSSQWEQVTTTSKTSQHMSFICQSKQLKGDVIHQECKHLNENSHQYFKHILDFGPREVRVKVRVKFENNNFSSTIASRITF